MGGEGRELCLIVVAWSGEEASPLGGACLGLWLFLVMIIESVYAT